MSDFFVWYFNLSAWGAIEFFFKSLLLMVLLSIPFLTVWCVYRYLFAPKPLPKVIQSGREQHQHKTVSI